MSLIIYSNERIPNQYKIKQISENVFNKLMYNEIHKRCRFVIPKDKIESEFGTINTTEQNINVIMMTELTLSQLTNYLNLYDDEPDNINEYAEFVATITYNQIHPEKFRVKKKLNSLISQVGEYWENPSNCNISLTHKFVERRFNNIFKSDTGANVGDNTLASNINWDAERTNYLDDLIRDVSLNNFMVKNYNLPKQSVMTNSDINSIYNALPDEHTKYSFLSNMLVSRTQCHHILNNSDLLTSAKPIFDKYKIAFKYLIGYSWIALKNEEYCPYYKITDDSRIVFDIDTASKLPIYPFSWDDINQNPYAGILINKKAMDLKNNCLSLNMMKNYEKYYGVCTSDEFSKRLNIFVNGENKKGVLDNIDWSCCAITGSAMTACGMKYNPLIDICKVSNNTNITDEDLSSFFFHYYQDSDIDLVCNKQTNSEFIEVVSDFVGKYPQFEKVNITDVHTGSMVLSDEFLLCELDEIRKETGLEKMSLEYVKSNFSSQMIKNYFYDKYYKPWKEEQARTFEIVEIQTNPNPIKIKLYQDYLKPVSSNEFRLYSMNYDVDSEHVVQKDWEKYFYYNDISNQNSEQNENIRENKKLVAKISESIRFKVKFPNTKTFEIFKSRNEHFFSTIAMFHMGFVRAFWNGQSVKCLPSYITSMMLQLATDYKYFASVKDPIEIVNKYRSRGFGIILNDHEKLHMAHYNSNSQLEQKQNIWAQIYNINIKSKESVKGIFGAKKSSDDIFKPSKFFMGLPQDCYKNVSHETLSTFEECFGPIIPVGMSSVSKYKAILDDGKINPFAREVIELCWNLLNQNKDREN